MPKPVASVAIMNKTVGKVASKLAYFRLTVTFCKALTKVSSRHTYIRLTVTVCKQLAKVPSKQANIM